MTIYSVISRSQVWDTPGTYQFDVPVGVDSVRVTMIGGGGSGGSSSTSIGGGGGGAAEWCSAMPVSLSQYGSPSSVTVVVGSGGVGVTGSTANGTASSFGPLSVAPGRGGGVGNVSPSGGIGGGPNGGVTGGPITDKTHPVGVASSLDGHFFGSGASGGVAGNGGGGDGGVGGSAPGYAGGTFGLTSGYTQGGGGGGGGSPPRTRTSVTSSLGMGSRCV